MASGQGADGQQYGVPFAIQMESIICNKGVFADNGITDPRGRFRFCGGQVWLIRPHSGLLFLMQVIVMLERPVAFVQVVVAMG